MRAVVVYESMYGNTHLVADAIGQGLEPSGEVTVVPVEQATPDLLEPADLVVVGGPTHAHAMTRESTRKSAMEAAQNPDSGLTVDPDAEGEGLREWFDALGDIEAAGAAFDTRIDMAATLTGRASKGISRKLRHHGFDEVAKPESFLVTKASHLEPGEEARARAWGEQLAKSITSSTESTTSTKSTSPSSG